MESVSTHDSVAPSIGGGIFLTNDVAEILHLPYQKVRRWMIEFWDTQLAGEYQYSFGEKGNKAINFYTLIEFYTFYQLRLKGLSTQKILKAHSIISKDLNTHYPFARSVRTDGRQIWYDYLDQLINANGKQQLDLKPILAPFLDRIEFGKNDYAERYFPLPNSKNVVVDPKHQFGQPTVYGRNIRTETLFKLYEGGESKKNISILYDLTSKQVSDAIRYYKRSA